jgi:hypothetical protein
MTQALRCYKFHFPVKLAKEMTECRMRYEEPLKFRPDFLDVKETLDAGSRHLMDLPDKSGHLFFIDHKLVMVYFLYD